MNRTLSSGKRMGLAFLALLLTANGSCEETTRQYSERFLQELRQSGLTNIGFDRIVLAQDLGLPVTITTAEPELLLGMPLVFKVSVENWGSESRQIVALDSGENGLWLLRWTGAAEAPHLVLADLADNALFEATLGEGDHRPFVRDDFHWTQLEPYLDLRPADALQGEFDISPLINADGDRRWVQHPGKFQFILIWFDRRSDVRTAIVAGTNFEVKLPTGEDAQVWQEISRVISKYDGTLPLSPMLYGWDPEFEAITQNYPMSVYTKYLYALKAWDLELGASRNHTEARYGKAAGAYGDFVRRYPDWSLADDALVGFARSLHRQALQEEPARAPELLKSARETLQSLPSRYPDSNCRFAAKKLLEKVEADMRKLLLLK